MALTVEDGTGVTDADSYADQTFLDTYHTNHGNSGWTFSEAAVRRAMNYIEGRYSGRWRGSKQFAYSVNSLSWPRTGAVDRDGLSIAGVPLRLRQALAEAALLEVGTAGTLQPALTRGGAIKRERVEGVVEREFFEGAPTRSTFTRIDDLLAPLLRATDKRSAGSLSQAVPPTVWTSSNVGYGSSE